MRKVIPKIAAVLLTFSLGYVAADLWATAPAHRAVEAPVAKPMIAELQTQSNASEGWRKVDVDGRFSFYLPPDMRKIEPLSTDSVLVFRRDKTPDSELLFLEYEEGKHISCDKDVHTLSKDFEMSRKSESELVIGGKRAKLSLWMHDPDSYLDGLSQSPEMILCFPDAGRGKGKMYFRAISPEPQAMVTAQQIFSSIEFP
jgi:hypothetical protein